MILLPSVLLWLVIMFFVCAMLVISKPISRNGMATPRAKPSPPSTTSQAPNTRLSSPMGRIKTSASIFSP